MRSQQWYSALILLLITCLGSCSTMVVDMSMGAFAAGDYTLLGSACEAAIGGGLDICRVTEGTQISSAWTLIVPKPGKAVGVTGGEVDVYYRDIHKSYAVTDWVLQIPWADFFGSSFWLSDMDGEVLALLTLNWTDAAGIHQVTQARGFAKIVVMKSGYARIPMDSGQAAWGTKCKIQVSTAGRSAVKCQ
jgi:hypothetical protein